MKRFVLVILLLSCFCCAEASGAEDIRFDLAGVTLSVPEDMIIDDLSDELMSILTMSIGDREEIVFYYVLFSMEALQGRGINDMSLQELSRMSGFSLELIIGSIEGYDGEVVELDGMSYVKATDPAGSEVHYLTIQDGWVSDAFVKNLEEAKLSDGDIEKLILIASEVSFD